MRIIWGGEDDLRHQHDGGASRGEHLLYQPQIDLGLSTAGDALEQHRLRLGAAGQIEDLGKGCLLLLAEDDGRPGQNVPGRRQPQRLLLGEGHKSRLFHGPEGRHPHAGEVAHFLGRDASGGSQQHNDVPTLGGDAPALSRGEQLPGVRRQGNHPPGPVPHLPLRRGLTDHGPRPLHGGEGGGDLVSAQLPKGLQLGRAAVGL